MTDPKESLKPNIHADKQWYLSLLDEATQYAYERQHIANVLAALKSFYLFRYQKRLAQIKAEIAEIKSGSSYSAEDYRAVLLKNAEVRSLYQKLDSYKCFFTEPYFARMDVEDADEGYNSYYIGKKGDVNLEIIDWRAPLAVRYYQKSRVEFTINETTYKTVLRRALSIKNGKLIDFKNEYLSVKGELSEEEIAGRDEEILFDPHLRSIIQSRKEDTQIRDIIRTIQEKQFDVITKPEHESFVLQGCAGSGKTMILLHRLSYLMYNNEKLRPRDVLVITPSDSFNAFIDDLSAVLELERVRTVTLNAYYFRVLKNEGIEIESKLTDEREPEEYLSYLYSPQFVKNTESRVGKIYDALYGMFTGAECREVAEQILADCRRRQQLFTRLKNASVRIRKAVLGELKEDAEGRFYFTKPLRNLMSAFVEAEDFLNFTLNERERTPDYFFRQFAQFYASARLIAFQAHKILKAASEDLAALTVSVEKEIVDLMRYKIKRGAQEVLTYTDRIDARKELLREAERAVQTVEDAENGLDLFTEFFGVIRATGKSRDLGKCKNAADVARVLYRETVKKDKKKYGMNGIYASDGYALCAVLAAAGRSLTPRYGLVFIDEGQDISEGEYRLLKHIHAGASFNVFGDLKQNITPYRGIKDWNTLNTNVYTLNRNYRNTNEIVEYVSGILDADMCPVGLSGGEVTEIKHHRLNSYFRGKQGLKAVIAKEEYLPLFEKRGFQRLKSKLSKTAVNVMSVYESKGLEFSAVAVYAKGMTENEKYIAFTRALRDLAVVTDAEAKRETKRGK